MSSARKAPPRDPNGRHVRVYCSLLDSPAWRTLAWSSRSLFFDLRSSLTGVNNGNISATLSVLKHRGWNSSATLAGALFELQALGFIAKTRGGGVEHGSKVCSLYRFTDVDCFEQSKIAVPYIKASHDYMRFKSVADAEAALHAAENERKGNAKCKKTTLQKLNRTASVSELKPALIASDFEADGTAQLQNLKQWKEA